MTDADVYNKTRYVCTVGIKFPHKYLQVQNRSHYKQRIIYYKKENDRELNTQAHTLIHISHTQ